MTTPPYDWTFRKVVWATLLLISVALSFWLLYRFSQVVFILFIAIILGTVLRPAVDWLYSRGIPRLAGGISVYLLLLVLLVGFILLLLPLVTQQSQMIFASLPGYYQSFRYSMMASSNLFIEHLSGFLPAHLDLSVLDQRTGQQTLDSVGQAVGFVSSLANVVFIGGAVLLLALYWTLYGSRTLQSLIVLLPPAQRQSTRLLVQAMEAKVGAYISGQGVLCVFIFILSLAAYMLIGLPFPLVLALAAGIMEIVPMVGPLIGAVPALIIALTISPTLFIWVVVATIVIQQAENSLLVPRVMRRAVGVNPFVSLLSIFAFSSLFGIAGALMAIPIAAILQLLLERFVFDAGSMETESSPGRDYSSRLRYEAQDLVQDLRKQARLKKGGSDDSIRHTDQVMDEIELLASDLDLLLAEASPPRTS
jgi:predicted PurR-regulated permease PerM